MLNLTSIVRVVGISAIANTPSFPVGFAGLGCRASCKHHPGGNDPRSLSGGGHFDFKGPLTTTGYRSHFMPSKSEIPEVSIVAYAESLVREIARGTAREVAKESRRKKKEAKAEKAKPAPPAPSAPLPRPWTNTHSGWSRDRSKTRRIARVSDGVK
ncbi:hypothetical protein Sinac_5921 [Singulisphaera acidiphila DSM 18658]|uniref:Uncharacterized protein n=1 Tax=Singulisphaera acidiphila (strain ATCC BAA-1392 / DSM 18658 / VKM B-2454 / MOB10) TaxID=886293 RepID=L0DMY9_SINAD|nr:hypothetical protein Sinac_5921 [Singulisphaera acidiphila DSM 18658]